MSEHVAMPLTQEVLEELVMSDRLREAAKHQHDCEFLKHMDGECRCEVDGCSMWCTNCGSRFSFEQSRGLRECSFCGSKSIPCSAIDDVQIKINWHELRIIMMLAENWAAKSDGDAAQPDYEAPPSFDASERRDLTPTVKAIARRLQRQFPTRTSLTFAGEAAQLVEVIPSAKVYGPIQPDNDMLPPKVQ